MQSDLDCGYNSPERLLLEAYKGLLSLVIYTDADFDADMIKESASPVIMILGDIHRALVKKEMEEFELEHPNINRTNK